jgi:uncharacterized membrane protein
MMDNICEVNFIKLVSVFVTVSFLGREAIVSAVAGISCFISASFWLWHAAKKNEKKGACDNCFHDRNLYLKVNKNAIAIIK